jgi:hypothetical protein
MAHRIPGAEHDSVAFTGFSGRPGGPEGCVP